MDPIVLTQNLAIEGVRVVRGPDWEWYDQDGGAGKVGIIVHDLEDGWVRVQWEDRTERNYRVGEGGKFDLAVHNPFVSTGLDLTTPRSKAKVQAMRQALSQSIKKTDSLIEKSNTKHVNSNTNHDNSGAIKVRRPVIKIQGTKG